MINLMHGDCLELMGQMPDKSIDMILCDLPYGTTSCKWDIVIPFDKLWEQYNRIIKEKGCIALFGSEPFSSYLRMSNIKNFRYDWIWEKNLASGFILAKKRPLNYYEIISIFYTKQCMFYPIFEEYAKSCLHRFSKNSEINSNKERLKGYITSKNKIKIVKHSLNFKRGKYPSNIRKIKCEHTANNNRLHPTQKPVELLEYLIKTYTLENEVVLDNCMGSGSTGVACINTNRDFIGIEKDDKYFEIARKRISG